MAELSRESAIPIATIKYYLREGLLPAGLRRGARQAEYDAGHVGRLRLIRALVDVGGLPLASVRSVLAILDEPSDDRPDEPSAERSDQPSNERPDDDAQALDSASAASRVAAAVGAAHDALPPDASGADDPPQRALDAVALLGWQVAPDSGALRQLEIALAAVEAVGLPAVPERLRVYGDAAEQVARLDISGMPGNSAEDAIRFAITGTVLYEPVLLALRRLAQQHLYISSR